MVHIKFAPQAPKPQNKRKIQEISEPDEIPAPKLKISKKNGVQTFDELERVPEELKTAIKEEFNFTQMTDIQQQAITAAINDNSTDIIAQARTGSGKTLAFLVPIIRYLIKRKFYKKEKGVGAIVLAPTRELAIQIKDVAEKILSNAALREHKIKCRSFVGGNMKKEKEALLLQSGECHLMIATPGRCLDHFNNSSFKHDKLKYFVLDEADMLIDIGFDREVKAIASFLPESRTTFLFSATVSEKVENLAKLSLRENVLRIGIEDSTKVNTLTQMYMETPNDKKVAALVTTLRHNLDKKIILFMGIKRAVSWVGELLTGLGIKNVGLHGEIPQFQRTQIFRDFMKDTEPGILIATDIAARGLDFPNVDLIIQCDIPDQIAQYFHRVGRTARGGKSGTAIIMLTGAEKDVALKKLKSYLTESTEITPYVVPGNVQDLDKAQKDVVDAVQKNKYLFDEVPKVVSTYQSFFNRSIKSMGFKKENFDTIGMNASFGL